MNLNINAKKYLSQRNIIRLMNYRARVRSSERCDNRLSANGRTDVRAYASIWTQKCVGKTFEHVPLNLS